MPGWFSTIVNMSFVKINNDEELVYRNGADEAILAGVDGYGDTFCSYDRVESASAVIANIEASRVHGQDAIAAGIPSGEPGGQTSLYLRGGLCHFDEIGVETNHTVVVECGIGGTRLNGETGQLNFHYGDNRIPGAPSVLCGEIGYVSLFDYDLDPVSGLPRTPYAFRIHSGVNPNTGAVTNLVLQGYGYATLEAEHGDVGLSVRDGYTISQAFPSSITGQGWIRKKYAYAATTTGTTPTVISLGDKCPQAKLASAELKAIGISTDFDSREVFKVKWNWFRSTAPVSLVEQYGDIGGFPSSTGRIVVGDNGGPLNLQITGVTGKTIKWTFCLTLDIQQ